MSASRRTLVIVGAGPRGTGLIERIAANAPELYGSSGAEGAEGPDGSGGSGGLDIHLVDPHPPGPIRRAPDASGAPPSPRCCG